MCGDGRTEACAALPTGRESVEKLERDEHALLESLIAMTLEALDGLAPVVGNIAAANEVGALEIASWR